MTRPVISLVLLVPLVPLVALALATAGCDGDPRSLRWQLEFAEPADRLAADQVAARVLRGGCDGTQEVYSATLREGSMAMAVPELEPGRYGFAARARDDATCRFVAEGCEERELPLEEGAEVITTLRSLTDGELDPGCTATCAVDPAPDGAWTHDVTIHVAPGGDDSNDGSSEALAVATLARALEVFDAAGTGGRIVLAPGRYVGGTQWYGTASSLRPLRIEGPADAILDGAGGEAALYLWSVSHVVIEGITLENADYPLRFEIDEVASERLVLRGVTVNGGLTCIRLHAVDDFWIEDTELVGCGYGIRLLASHRGVVRNNRVHGGAGPGIAVEGGTRDVLVHGNLFRDLGREAIRAGGNSVLSFWRPADATEEARRVWFLANLIHRAGGADRGPVTFESCHRCVVANNTIVQPSGALVGILPGNAGATTPTSENVFVNNIVDFSVGEVTTYVEVGGGEVSPETFVFGGNLFHARGGGDFDSTPPDGATMAAPSISDDPAFVAYDADDFRLSERSPAIGAGAPLDYADYDPVEERSPVGDHEGVCFRDPPSIGGWER